MTENSSPELKHLNYYRRERNWTQNFFISRNSRILDIGCGHGLLGKYLQSTLDAEVTGVEIIESCYIEAKSVLNNAIYGNIETMNLDILGNNYDYVIFSDSLEHLINPGETLFRVSSLLKDNGHLLISIPNVQNFRVTVPLVFRGSWEYKDEGLMDKSHLRWFTESSISSLVEDNGYKIIKIARELPLKSISGKLNMLTLGLFKNHLTSHFYLDSCLNVS